MMMLEYLYVLLITLGRNITLVNKKLNKETMKINFKQLKVYVDINKTVEQYIDVAKDLAEGLYKTSAGIAGHSLALKIYNSTGEEDYSELEVDLITKYANQYATPFFIDALSNIKNE